MLMIFRVDYLIYIYIALCMCILLFDFYYMLKMNRLKKQEPKKTERYVKHMLPMLDSEIQQMSKREQRYWVRRLRKYSKLLIFNEAVEQIASEEQGKSRIKKWLWINRELFLKISDSYTKGNQRIKKAFFAYIVWQYELCGKEETDFFVQLMYQLCMEPSLYCRENALCGLYKSGSAENVVKAYQLLGRQGIEHSSRLVTDGLLMFSGNHNELADALWKHKNEFSVSYQIAFINYIRMTSGEFGERFFPILVEVDIENEVRFAVIRYYRRYYYGDAAPILQAMVRDWKNEDWEFASIAALALDNYPGDESAQALLEGCRSGQWHVRENAAESLLNILEPDKICQSIEQESDYFAKDILTYKWSRKQEEAAI